MRLRSLVTLILLVGALGAVGSPPAPAAEKGEKGEKGECGQPTSVRLQGLPVGVGACPGVRPGAYVSSEVGGCTMNFLFDGSDGKKYIGTAGHCIIEKDGQEKVWAGTSGPIAKDSSGDQIGHFAYGVLSDPKDFALIRLDPGVEVNPSVCYFGGPTGLYDEESQNPVVLHHFGNGIGIGDVLPARTAVADNTRNPDMIYSFGAAIFGDSGSGVITDDGRAAGVLVTLQYVPIDGNIGITRLPPQIERAQSKMGLGLKLVTAPLA